MRLHPGTRLGAYEILEPIGAGGMGEVYRARDPRLGRDIAIKILSPAVSADPSALQRFVQEARAAATLNHPNIIAVHDIGAHEGSPYIVSELLHGQTLRDELSAGALPPTRALDHARQIVSGLSAAHEKGIVHRDLKPDNIFVAADGRVKILDFGLARLLGGGSSPADDETIEGFPTSAGTVLGTAGYMSPEQVRGEPADHRADLFSFGAVLYEMLAGRRAFLGRTAIEAMSAVLRDEPAEVPSSGEMAPSLQRVARRCLAKRPQDRFQSARDLGFALAEADIGSPLPLTPGRVGGGRTRLILATAAFIVVAAAGFATYRSLTTNAAPGTRIDALAVLPLRNLSNDPEQEYFADGMTEELISNLARVGGLRVTSRTSAMTFKTSAQTTLPQIAAQLGVDAVIEGSVARVGDRVRISVQLIRADTDTPLWTNSYERDLGDVLSLQARVAREIAQEIKVTLTPLEQKRLAVEPVVNRDAHENYLRGRYFLAKATEETITRAIGAFTAAAESEPGYARAHAGLADAYTALRSTYLPPHVVMPKAKIAAARALELDPDLAEAHVSMAGILMFYDFDWAAAESHLKRAIELSPSLADAHDYYALYLAALGRHAEAQAESARARELDPLSLLILVDTGWVHYLARDYAKTIEMDLKALEIDPNFWPALRDLGLAYEKQGRFPEAVAVLQKARSIDPNPSILEMLGGAYAAWGKKAEARQILAELTAAASRQYVCPFEIATVHAALGDRKATLAWLEKGYADRADCMPWARSDAKLDGMKDYPGFDELMRRMGFPR